MIGGEDIVIPTFGWSAALECSVRLVRVLWPDAVFVNALTSESWDRFESIPFGRCSEILVYRNKQVRAITSESGVTPEVESDVLYLLQVDSELTIVVGDSENAISKSILKAIRSRIQMAIQLATPSERAA